MIRSSGNLISVVMCAVLCTACVAQEFDDAPSFLTGGETRYSCNYHVPPTLPCLDEGGYRVFDHLEFFAGLDGSKQPQDFGVNAHFGLRFNANLGIPILPDSGLGLQIGTGINQSDHAVAVTSALEGSSTRTQSFTTLGLFQRLDSGLNWASVFDYLYQQDYDSTTMSQWRSRVGYQWDEQNEFGLFGMLPLTGADATWGAVPVELEPIGQISTFWRHTWKSQAETTFWLGVAEGHGQANVALGDDNPTDSRVVFGADFHVPLNDRCALYGEANFVRPADTGTVDAYLGLAFYPGRTVYGWRKRDFVPLLPVANNTSMSIDLRR